MKARIWWNWISGAGCHYQSTWCTTDYCQSSSTCKYM